METKLPTFEGRIVEAASLRLTGTATERIGALRDDEEVFVICRGRVSKVSHGDGKVNGAEVYVREHVVKCDRLVIVDPEQGAQMLDEAQMLADDAFGLADLFRQGRGPDTETGEVQP